MTNKLTKKDLIALSIFCAEISLEAFEKLYPDDDRPRKAIDAANAVLAHDTAKNRAIAKLAGTAARSAAEWAWLESLETAKISVRSAGLAGELARLVAESAAKSEVEISAWATWTAVEISAWATWAAVKITKSATKKIDKWKIARVKENV